MHTQHTSYVTRGLFALLFALILIPLSGCPLFFSGPSAAFSASAVNGSAPFTVTFTNESDAGSFPLTSLLWDFGDGTTSTDEHPTHTYAGAGTYSVSLKVTTKFGSDTEKKEAYISVGKATPTISGWPVASAITYGQTLASSTLSGGSASVEGAFAFVAPDTAPAAGSYAAEVIFTPTDAVNNNPVAGTVSVVVNPAAPVVSAWPTASPITYGQTLAVSILTGGAASVEGTFSFVAPDIAPAVGSYDAPLSFTPLDAANYSVVSGSVAVTVNPAAPLVSAWPTASAITLGQTLAASTLTGGSASVEGAFAFASPDTKPSSGVYTASIRFVPADAVNYTIVLGNVDVTVQSDVGAIWYVTPDGTGSGTSWNDSFGSIQTAVDTASAAGGGEIWVASGTYTGIANTVLMMAASAHLYGGFAGTERLHDERDWTANKTIIDGQSARRCVQGANDATLDGFVVRNGHAIEGAGMYNDHASLSIANCIFTENETTEGAGGGMYNIYSSPTVTDCIFTRNMTQKTGGGMCNINSSPVLTHCSFSANSAYDGGGIYGTLCVPTIINCRFIGNNATDYGGGICLGSSIPTIKGCAFLGNRTDRHGGGLSVLDSTFAVESCVFFDNISDLDGGAAYAESSDHSFYNCLFAGNRAYIRGSAITGSQMALSSVCAMTNCVFTGNNGQVLDLGVGIQTLTNCILWDNSGSAESDLCGPECVPDGNYPVVTYSCVQGGYEGVGNISTDPLLLTDNGLIGRIRSDSSCIDAGTAVGAPGTDIVGTVRPYGSGVDIGLYEMDDSDGDGISDTWEETYFDDLTQATSESDADDDTLPDIDESLYGSNPLLPDTDKDGYTDGDEAARGWNPTLVSGIRRVNAANTSTNEDGLTWETGFSSIQAAIDSIMEGEVWVSAGTHVQMKSSIVVVMKKRIHLYGGFSGSETERDARDWNTNPTVISGSGYNRCILGESESTIDGFVVTSGRGESGSGLQNTGCAPTVRNCTFTSNAAWSFGGAVANASGASATFINCVFAHNTSRMGGCIYMFNSTSTFTNCTFYQNSADRGGITYGVGDCVLNFSNCVFWGNSALAAGTEFSDIWNFTPVVTYSCIEGGHEGAGNIALDPLFMDPASDDFTLQAGSPCIGTGTAAGAPEVDILGVTRPQGVGFDMGAYEYVPLR